MTELPHDDPNLLGSEQTHQAADGYAALAGTTGGAADERMAVTERFLGLAEDVRFEDAVTEKLAAEKQLGNIQERQALIEAHGVTVDAAIAPQAYELEKLSPQDWEVVKASERPLLTLYAASNYRREEAETTFRPAGKQFPRHEDPRRGADGLENRAMIASLPLVHGLSADAFVRLAENGVMQSNKTRYKQSGGDALTFHGAGVGMTNLQDRELGLDQYVFFDFGRPAVNHREQPEITLVVDPSVMDQEGGFMTTRDIADTTSASEYMRGLTTPEYFRETALLRIHNMITEQGETRSGGYHTGYSVYGNVRQWLRGQDGDFNQNNYPAFSTYEVKVPDPPGVQTSAIRRVIVRDQATFEHLQTTMGDQFEFVHEPHLRPAGGIKPDFQGDPRSSEAIDQGNYHELFQIPGVLEQKLEELIEADYQQRATILDGLSDDEKEQAVVVFASSNPDTLNGEDVKTRITDKTNPYQRRDFMAVYPSIEALRADVQNTNDLREDITAAGRAPWFYDPYRYSGEKTIATSSGQCVIAIIEKSKQDPGITRIIDARGFGLDEVMSVAS